MARARVDPGDAPTCLACQGKHRPHTCGKSPRGAVALTSGIQAGWAVGWSCVGSSGGGGGGAVDGGLTWNGVDATSGGSGVPATGARTDPHGAGGSRDGGAEAGSAGGVVADKGGGTGSADAEEMARSWKRKRVEGP